MPVEVIERILVETVLAQTLRASTTTCAIKICSHHDDNLIDVCLLWKQIIHGRRFREILLLRVSTKDPKAMYKPRADPVKVRGILVDKYSSLMSVAKLNDVLYAIEYQRQTDTYSISAYDMQLSPRLLDKNLEGRLEVVLSNKRRLPGFDSHELIVIIPSAQGNCLYLASDHHTTNPQLHKLAPDGAVLASWDVDDGAAIHSTAIDPSGRHLVVVTYFLAHVFNSVGSVLATIPLEHFFQPLDVGILQDATVVMTYKKYVPTKQRINPNIEYSGRVKFIKARQTSDGLLQYEDLSSAITVKLPEGHYATRCDYLFVDSCGCLAVIQSNHLVLVDPERRTARSAKHWKKKENSRYPFCLDESSGLLFSGTRRELYASQVRHIL